MGPKFAYTDKELWELKEKFSRQMRYDEDNPIAICVRLIYEAAIEKNHVRRLELSENLSKFLTKPDGLMNLFLSLLDFDSTSQQITTHNQRFTAVSRIITCLPKLCIPYYEYCDNIFKQLKPLLIHDNPSYTNLASIIVRFMIESPHAQDKHIETMITGHLIRSIEGIGIPQLMKPDEAILCTRNLLVNNIPVKPFIAMFPNLFKSYIALRPTGSNLKALIKESLLIIVESMAPGVACIFIMRVVSDDDVTVRYPASFLSEGITIEQKVAAVIDLLESSCNDPLMLEFFFHLQDIMRTTDDDEMRNLSIALLEPLLTHSIIEESSRLNILEIIVNNNDRSLDLIHRNLIGYVEFFRNGATPVVVGDGRILDSLKNCLDILDVLATTSEFNGGNCTTLRRSIPLLDEIRKILVAIQGERTNEDYSKLIDSLDYLIEKLEKIFAGLPRTSETTSDDKAAKEVDAILKDLNDRLVPVRAHALIRLKQMILANDKYVVSQIPRLYSMVVSTLSSCDSYLLLAAINLVAEMVVRRTSELLPELIGLFNDENFLCLEDQDRVRVGEVIARVTRQLNATTPFYAQQMLNALFPRTKDPDDSIKMSSLTLIGEISKNLGESLSGHMVEIMQCVQAALKDPTPCVRGAAINLVRNTLTGLNRNNIESVQRELKEIYALLKDQRMRNFYDKTVLLQTDLALQEMDRIARELILGTDSLDVQRNEVKLVKSINVLSLHHKK